MGIVGMPNVGKSSLFNLLSKSEQANAANFPFATIDPEESRVLVKDARFDFLVDLYAPKSVVPAHLTVLDIAGLTAGASTGAGLGNAFLSNVRAVDGIFQVVRAFSDDEVTHVEGDVDPVRDMEIISTELRLKDLEWTEKALEQAKSKSRLRTSNSTEAKRRDVEKQTIEKLYQLLSEGRDVRKGEWADEEIEVINSLTLLTAKPLTYLVNVNEQDFADMRKNPWINKIQQWVDQNNPGDMVIPVSMGLEQTLLALESPTDQDAALKELGPSVKSALTDITLAGYQALDLICYFTAGKDEVRAWTVRRGTLAPQAAAVIHSDFEKRFISAEVMLSADLIQAGSESALRAAGKYHNKGRGWPVEDGAICFWKLS